METKPLRCLWIDNDRLHGRRLPISGNVRGDAQKAPLASIERNEGKAFAA